MKIPEQDVTCLKEQLARLQGAMNRYSALLEDLDRRDQDFHMWKTLEAQHGYLVQMTRAAQEAAASLNAA